MPSRSPKGSPPNELTRKLSFLASAALYMACATSSLKVSLGKANGTAGTTFFLVPIVVFTVLLRKHLLRGITFGAVRK